MSLLIFNNRLGKKEEIFEDRAEWHDLKFLLFILLFFFSPFLGGKRKGEQNNQSHDFKSCLIARSFLGSTEIVLPCLAHGF